MNVRLRNTLLALIVAAFVVRIALSAISFGTFDTSTWKKFADAIDDHGLRQLYASDLEFVHPPIPALWAMLASRAGRTDLAKMIGISFPFIFKLPMIAADAITCMLLWNLWKARAALYAWSPVAILVAAHHGNTDSIYAML